MTQRLPLSVMDTAFVAQTMPGRPMTTHHALELVEGPPAEALAAAAVGLAEERPELRAVTAMQRRELVRTVEPFSRAKATAQVSITADARPIGETGWLDAPFTLESEWPFRVRSAPTPEGRHAVTFTLHHSVTDGRGALTLFDRYLQRLAHAWKGTPLSPLEAASPEQVSLQDALLARPKLLAQLGVNVARNAGRFWQHRAALLETPDADKSHFGLRVDDVPADLWRSLKDKARALGCTRNDLLWCAALVAGDRFRVSRGLPELPFRVVGGVDLRDAFDARNASGNWIGTLEADFAVNEVRSFGLPSLVHQRLEAARAPEHSLVTLLLMGALGRTLTPARFRDVFRRADLPSAPYMYSMLLSHIRPPGQLCWPEALSPVRLWCTSTLPRKPGLGFTVTTVGEQVTLATCWPVPLSSAPAVEGLVAALLEELRRLSAGP